jgi:hypothetical protein
MSGGSFRRITLEDEFCVAGLVNAFTLFVRSRIASKV